MIESTLILDRIITSIMTLYFIAIAIWIIWLLLIAISNITKKIKNGFSKNNYNMYIFNSNNSMYRYNNIHYKSRET